ncbi:hypothetical protein HDV57DRAFT_501718 [Trichoderma longibrachiatum]
MHGCPKLSSTLILSFPRLSSVSPPHLPLQLHSPASPNARTNLLTPSETVLALHLGRHAYPLRTSYRPLGG